MVRDELTMRDAASTAATVIAAGGTLILTLALLAELLRRRNANSRWVVLADRILPSATHRIAVTLLTVVSTMTALFGPTAASADTSVRNWLTRPGITSSTTTSTSTSTSSPIPTSTSTSTRDSNPVTQPPRGLAPSSPGASISAADPTTNSVTAGVPRPSAVVHTTRPQTHAPPVAPATPAPTEPAPPTSANLETHHVVAPGDCLWNIAARTLGPRTTNRAIDRGWRAIYDANRTVIGDDPNRITPGQTLTIPALDPTP